MNFLKRFDAYTWGKLPSAIQGALDRTSWWKILVVYIALAVLLLYRFVIIRRSIFFHSYPASRAHEFTSETQLRELLIHLIFFFLPMILAITFNYGRRLDTRPT